MKKILFIVLIPLLIACNDDSDNSMHKNYVSIGTVENPDSLTSFYIHLDDSTTLRTAATDFINYRPRNGQRIIAYYNILSDMPSGSLFNHYIKLNDVYHILTKNIFNLTPATKDSIGNDYIYINNVWISSNYLNVEFVYPGSHKIHFINLVKDPSKTYTDNKIHLEFRHNANGDYPEFNRWGMVSFDLSSIKDPALTELNLVIHTREFNYTNPEKIYEFVYKYANKTMQISQPKSNMQVIHMEQEKAKIQ